MRHFIVAIIVFYVGSAITGDTEWSLGLGGVAFVISLFLWDKSGATSSSEKSGSNSNIEKSESEHSPGTAKGVKKMLSGVEIVGFGSRNNLLTAGNNSVVFEARNHDDVAHKFRIELKAKGKWKMNPKEFKIGPKDIQKFDTLGPAWSKATDIRVAEVK